MACMRLLFHAQNIPDVHHGFEVSDEVVEDDGDGLALAHAAAKEGNALRMRAQPRVHITEGTLQEVLLRMHACIQGEACVVAEGTTLAVMVCTRKFCLVSLCIAQERLLTPKCWDRQEQLVHAAIRCVHHLPCCQWKKAGDLTFSARAPKSGVTAESAPKPRKA